MRRYRDPRIGVFEKALSTGERNLAEEILRGRHDYWSGQLAGRPPAEATVVEERVESVAVTGIVTAEIMVYIAFLFGLLGIVAFAAILNVLALLIAIPVAFIWILRIVAKRASAARAKLNAVNELSLYKVRVRGQCLKCRYDLTRCNDELELESSVQLGPRRCPECGSFWPRVPEPTPDEMQQWHHSWFIKR